MQHLIFALPAGYILWNWRHVLGWSKEFVSWTWDAILFPFRR